MLTTLISDCDGVLIDSEVVAFEVFVTENQQVFPHIDVAYEMRHGFGQKTEELVRQLARIADSTIPQGFLERLRKVTDQTIEARAQLIPHVEVLMGYPRLKAVASNSGTARVQAAARKAGVYKRSDILVFSADQVAKPKPAPDLYQLVAKTLGVQSEQCLVIEDSISGITAAQAAGMQAISFVGGSHIRPEHAQAMRQVGVLAVFDDMRDLPSVLEQTVGWVNH